MLESLYGKALIVGAISFTTAILLISLLIYRHHRLLQKYDSNHEPSLSDFESLGFLKNQVVPYQVKRPNGETIDTWIVLPTRLFIKHESVLSSNWTTDELRQVTRDLFIADDENNFVIYFPDSSSSLAMDGKSDIYRSISSGDPDHIYAIQFDYPQGASHGIQEQDAVDDAVLLVDWVHNEFSVPYSRIGLLGHGFGSSIVTSAIETILSKNPYVEFAGFMLCSPFTDTYSSLISDAHLPNPISAVLRSLLRLQVVQQRLRIAKTDPTQFTERIRKIVETSEALRLTLVESESDAVTTSPDTIATSVQIARSQLKSQGPFEENENNDRKSSGIVEYRFGSRLIRHITIQDRNKGFTSRVSGEKIMRCAPVNFEVAKMFQNAGLS